MKAIDILVIGAGPAGISTALHLLRADPAWAGRMLLLEKGAHPRHKLCGGGVTRLGLDILNDLGFSHPLPIPHALVEDVRLVYAARSVHVRGRPQFVVYQRAELDAYLAQQARFRGAVICENEPVITIEPGPSGVRVTTDRDQYDAQVVVGADGSRGVVRRTVAGDERRTRVARLLEVLAPAAENAPHFTGRYAVFDFNPARYHLQGYFWDFPSRPNGLPMFNRGVYDARVVSGRPRADLPKVLERCQQGLEANGEPTPLAGHPIHWFSPRNRFAAPRLLLAGDAAGADPLFGEGIAPALGYGKIAAQAVEQAFASGDFSFRTYRRRLLASPVGRYLLVRWAIAEVGYRCSNRPWFMQLVWSLGGALARAWPKLSDLY